MTLNAGMLSRAPDIRRIRRRAQSDESDESDESDLSDPVRRHRGKNRPLTNAIKFLLPLCWRRGRRMAPPPTLSAHPTWEGLPRRDRISEKLNRIGPLNP